MAALASLGEALRLYLELGDAGVLLLVERAELAGLRPLVLELWPAYPDLEVVAAPEELLALPPGAVAILVLDPGDLTAQGRWLNLHRTLFADRALRVILYCQGDVAERLVQAAPDFTDWISHRLSFPAELRGLPPAHLVLGLRALLRLRAPVGLIPNDSMLVERLVRAALPGWTAIVSTVGTYQGLMDKLQLPGRVLLGLYADSDFALRRLRVALRESGRRRPVLLLEAPPEAGQLPGVVSLGEGLLPLRGARQRLARARRPGRLAALLGLEVPAVAVAADLLAQGAAEAELCEALAGAVDPGARVGALGQAQGLQSAPLGSLVWRLPGARLAGADRRAVGLAPDARAAVAVGDIPLALRLDPRGIRGLARARAVLDESGIGGGVMASVLRMDLLALARLDDKARWRSVADTLARVDEALARGFQARARALLCAVIDDLTPDAAGSKLAAALCGERLALALLLGPHGEEEEDLRTLVAAFAAGSAQGDEGALAAGWLEDVISEALTNIAWVRLLRGAAAEAEEALRQGLSVLRDPIWDRAMGLQLLLTCCQQTQGAPSTEVAPAVSRCVLTVLRAEKDAAHAQELAAWLGSLEPATEIALEARTARGEVIVVLLSAELLADDEAFAVLEAARARRVPLFPVLLRPCDWWSAAPLADLGVLPVGGRAISSWSDQREAWLPVLREVQGRLYQR